MNTSSKEKVKALLQIISVNSPNVQIPREKFKGYLRNTVGAAAANGYVQQFKRAFEKRKEKLSNIELKISPLVFGLYNAVVDVGHEINIPSIVKKVEDNGLANRNDIKVTEFSSRFGKFQTALKYTKEYGMSGNATNKKLASADFKIKMGSGGASLSYFKSGKVRFSGGHSVEPKKLLKFFSENYYTIPPNSEIKFNNVVAEFKIGFRLKTSLIYDMFAEAIESSFKGEVVVAKWNAKRKLLYLNFGKKFSATIANSGIVQIKGTTDVEEAYKLLKQFFNVLKTFDFLEISGNANQNTNIGSPKNTKIARRLNNMPAPNVTRRGTTCPMDRRPDPYSYEGKCGIPGCYIKPNPQGQPCCYTIPKSIKYSQNKVENAYRKAGVKVPANVRKLFGIGHDTNNRPANVANKKVVLNLKLRTNNKSGFMINSRQCLRYTKVALVDIAHRLKIPLPSKLTKPVLCALIKEHKPAKPAEPVEPPRLMSGNTNKNFRLGGRKCSSYPRETLVKFAEELKGKVPESATKEEICTMIRMLSKKLRTNENVYNYIDKVGKSNKDFNYFMRGPKAKTS
jgi:TATA-box binding protein (TBP) (component of TFIID and TFIIIB)